MARYILTLEIEDAFFFRERAKYPKFKKKGKHESFYLANDKFRVDGSGHINTELILTDRTYVCKGCRIVNDRDLNAAINLNTVGTTLSQPRQSAWMKQEAKSIDQ